MAGPAGLCARVRGASPVSSFLAVLVVFILLYRGSELPHTPFPGPSLAHSLSSGGGGGSSASGCPLVFTGYAASSLETDWASHARTLPQPLSEQPFCGEITSPPFLERMRAWIGIGAHQTSVHAVTPADRAEQAEQLRARGTDVFSRMLYRDPCTDEVVAAHTSPLAGHLRDPRALCQYPGQLWAEPDWPRERIIEPLLPFEGGRDYQEKDPVILDPAYMSRVAASLQRTAPAGAGGHAPRRALLFDAGASIWSQTDFGGKWPGTRWLYERYRDLGVEFDEIFAWEAAHHPGYEYYEGMDEHLMSKVHFYNYPVSADPGPRNPLTVLKRVARPGDFVVFKLDIDTPDIERSILEQLIEDKEAHRLVAHFFFELHYGLKEMQGIWDDNMPGDVLTTADLFLRLRKAGINAQFWP